MTTIAVQGSESIVMRPMWGPLVEVAPIAAAWIHAFSCVSPIPTVVGLGVPELSARWWGATVGSVAVLGCNAVDTSVWSGGTRTMMAARFPVSLGLGLRASGWVWPHFAVAPALDEVEARRFFVEPSEVAPRGLLGALAEMAEGRFAILTDTHVYLDPNPEHGIDDVARFLARFAELVAARKYEIGSPPAQRERATGLAEALAAHDATVDPRHDSVIVHVDNFVVEAVHFPDAWDPYTHVQLTFPVALGPPFVVRRASGLVPQIFASDTAIGDGELDRKLAISARDPASVAAILGGPLRAPLLALRERHPTFTFTERVLDVATRGAFSVTATAALVEELLDLASSLTPRQDASPYR